MILVPLILGLAAAVYDMRHRRIPNQIPLILLLSGLLVNSGRIPQSVLPIFLVLFLWWKGFMPAGDAKFMISLIPWSENSMLVVGLSFLLFFIYSLFSFKFSLKPPRIVNIPIRFLAFFSLTWIAGFLKMDWYVIITAIYVATELMNSLLGPKMVLAYALISSIRFVVDENLISSLLQSLVGSLVFFALDYLVDLYRTERPAKMSDIREGVVIEGYSDDGLTKEEVKKLKRMIKKGEVELSELRILYQRPFGGFIFISFLIDVIRGVVI